MSAAQLDYIESAMRNCFSDDAIAFAARAPMCVPLFKHCARIAVQINDQLALQSSTQSLISYVDELERPDLDMFFLELVKEALQINSLASAKVLYSYLHDCYAYIRLINAFVAKNDGTLSIEAKQLVAEWTHADAERMGRVDAPC